MGDLFHYVENTHFLELILNPESLEQFLQEQLLDRFLKFKSWRILDNLDLKLQFHHITMMKS